MSAPAGSEGVSGAPGVAEVHPVPHPPVTDVSARARALAVTMGCSPETAQKGLDKGWLK